VASWVDSWGPAPRRRSPPHGPLLVVRPERAAARRELFTHRIAKPDRPPRRPTTSYLAVTFNQKGRRGEIEGLDWELPWATRIGQQSVRPARYQHPQSPEASRRQLRNALPDECQELLDRTVPCPVGARLLRFDMTSTRTEGLAGPVSSRFYGDLTPRPWLRNRHRSLGGTGSKSA